MSLTVGTVPTGRDISGLRISNVTVCVRNVHPGGLQERTARDEVLNMPSSTALYAVSCVSAPPKLCPVAEEAVEGCGTAK